jgi:hypothetical protein
VTDVADWIARELPTATLISAHSILEWRIAPKRLDRALISFLDDVWALRALA